MLATDSLSLSEPKPNTESPSPSSSLSPPSSSSLSSSSPPSTAASTAVSLTTSGRQLSAPLTANDHTNEREHKLGASLQPSQPSGIGAELAESDSGGGNNSSGNNSIKVPTSAIVLGAATRAHSVSSSDMLSHSVSPITSDIHMHVVGSHESRTSQLSAHGSSVSQRALSATEARLNGGDSRTSLAPSGSHTHVPGAPGSTGGGSSASARPRRRVVIQRAHISRRARALLDMFGSRVSMFRQAFRAFAGNDSDVVSVKKVHELFASNGIDVKTVPYVDALLERMTERSATPGTLEFCNTFFDQSDGPNAFYKVVFGEATVPDWSRFTQLMHELYADVKKNTSGRPSPALECFMTTASQSEPPFAVACCTLDGQVFELGPTRERFVLYDCVQPLIYALMCEQEGTDTVHSHVGKEPTSRSPYGFAMTRHNFPYNPFMDSGALAITSLLYKQRADAAGRFKFATSFISDVVGGEKVSFQQVVYLEQKSKDSMIRAVANVARGRAGVMSPGVTPNEACNMYMQLRATQLSTRSLAVAAATLANKGTCPLTKKSVLSSDVIRTVLSVTYSCGMNAASGRWNFQVGVPGASSRSGYLFVIVPNLMGIAIYSPMLDKDGVCVRGFEFARRLVQRQRMSLFDSLVYEDDALAANQHDDEDRSGQHKSTDPALSGELLSAAANGDAKRLKVLLVQGADPNSADYDKRTALHLACCEGHLTVAKLLLEAGSRLHVRDRWGNSPFDDAEREHRHHIVDYLTAVSAQQKAAK